MLARSLRWLVVTCALLVAALVATRSYVDALALIARAAGMGGYPGRLADWRAHGFVADPVQRIPTRHGTIDVRLYRPATGAARRAITLVPGVHMDGIRETRLVGLAEDLATSGFAVLTVSTPDLQRFRITAVSTDIIEDAASWLASQVAANGPLATLADAADRKIGMVGISFSGGLSVVAAGRPALRDRVSFVMSFGGHGDMTRVMQYIASGQVPAAPPLEEIEQVVAGVEHLVAKPPHDYAVAVVLLGFVDRIVPSGQVEPLRRGILSFLTASSLTLVDMGRAEAEFKHAREYAETLPEPSKTLMQHVNDRAVDKIGPVLRPAVEGLRDGEVDAALSPERSPAPSAQVFLLHGAEDNVIPSVETLLLARYLRDRTAVHAVLSGLVTHAEVDRPPTATELWRLVRFWQGLMTQ
jgi:dienelactone hydrolase